MAGGLLLGRRKGEAILIGDDTEVTVLRFDGTEVELEIKAPARYGGNRDWTGKLREVLQLGKDISVVVADITMDVKQLTLHGTDQVKLRILAPRHVEVWRKELRK
jgi:sRNA-binding carbon storage regulator CsrA